MASLDIVESCGLVGREKIVRDEEKGEFLVFDFKASLHDGFESQLGRSHDHELSKGITNSKFTILIRASKPLVLLIGDLEVGLLASIDRVHLSSRYLISSIARDSAAPSFRSTTR